MRRPLNYPAAIYVWLAVTIAGVVAALAVGRAAWAVAGWAVGGVAAAVVNRQDAARQVVDGNRRRPSRQWGQAAYFAVTV